MSTLIALNSKALEFTSKPLKMFIGGRWVDARSGKRTEIRNPATGEVITTAAEGDKEDVILRLLLHVKHLKKDLGLK